jgi:hypothetical protein
MITETDFRNYANDMFDFDTGTLAGLEKYIEWIEELICDDEKLQKVKCEIKERKGWFKSF